MKEAFTQEDFGPPSSNSAMPSDFRRHQVRSVDAEKRFALGFSIDGTKFRRSMLRSLMLSLRRVRASHLAAVFILVGACNSEHVTGLKPPSSVSNNMATVIVWGDQVPGFSSWVHSMADNWEPIEGWSPGGGGGEYGGFICDWQCANSTNYDGVPPVVAEYACNPNDPACHLLPTSADTLFFSTISKYYVDPATMADTAMANACRRMEARVSQLWATGKIFRGNPNLPADTGDLLHAGATAYVKLASTATFHIDARWLDLAEADSTSSWYGPTVAATMLHEAAHTGLPPSPYRAYAHPNGFDANKRFVDYPFNYVPNNGEPGGCVIASVSR